MTIKTVDVLQHDVNKYVVKECVARLLNSGDDITHKYFEYEKRSCDIGKVTVYVIITILTTQDKLHVYLSAFKDGIQYAQQKISYAWDAQQTEAYLDMLLTAAQKQFESKASPLIAKFISEL